MVEGVVVVWGTYFRRENGAGRIKEPPCVEELRSWSGLGGRDKGRDDPEELRQRRAGGAEAWPPGESRWMGLG